MCEIRPVKRSTNSIKVANQLIKLINKRAFKPGEKLPSESRLGEKFNVSRSNIREALRGLEMMDIIETKPGIGSFVKDKDLSSIFKSHPQSVTLTLDKEALEELLEVRLILETNVAFILTSDDNNDFTPLETIITEMETSLDKGKSIFDLGLKFHEELFRMTNNSALIEIYNLIKNMLHKYQEQAWFIYGGKEEIKLHKELLKCLKKHDPFMAWETMFSHLEVTHNNIMMLINEQQEK